MAAMSPCRATRGEQPLTLTILFVGGLGLAITTTCGGPPLVQSSAQGQPNPPTNGNESVQPTAGAVGSSSGASEVATRCVTDSDCVMSTEPSDCCDPCGCSGVPYAIHAADLERMRARCDGVECAEEDDIACEPCPPDWDDSQAVCQTGACVWQRP